MKKVPKITIKEMAMTKPWISMSKTGAIPVVMQITQAQDDSTIHLRIVTWLR